MDSEHSQHHHPEIRAKVKADEKNLPPKTNPIAHSLNAATKRGYARFGTYNGEHYIDYDKNHPHGQRAAVHALKYLSPEHGSRIAVTNQPWGRKLGRKNGRIFYNNGAAARHIMQEEVTVMTESDEHGFHTYDEVEDWIEAKAKEYGGRNKFLASDEYRKAYPTIQKLHKASKDSYAGKGQTAMAEVGVAFGNHVYYDHVSPFGHAEKYSGVIVNKGGVPYVKLDGGKKSLSGKTMLQWHKGWRKLN